MQENSYFHHIWMKTAKQVLKENSPNEQLTPGGERLLTYYMLEGFSPYNAVQNLLWYIVSGKK